MESVHCRERIPYMPGENLAKSAHFPPMAVGKRNHTEVHANSNPYEVKKVRLVHASILSAIEEEMARVYFLRSFDGQLRGSELVTHAKDDNFAKCQVDATELRSSHPRIAASFARYVGITMHDSDFLMLTSDRVVVPSNSTAAGSNRSTGISLETPMLGGIGISLPDSASEESGPAHTAPTEAYVGSRGHGRGLCKPCAFFPKQGCSLASSCSFCHLCAAGERKRRKKELKAFWRNVNTPDVSR